MAILDFGFWILDWQKAAEVNRTRFL